MPKNLSAKEYLYPVGILSGEAVQTVDLIVLKERGDAVPLNIPRVVTKRMAHEDVQTSAPEKRIRTTQRSHQLLEFAEIARLVGEDDAVLGEDLRCRPVVRRFCSSRRYPESAERGLERWKLSYWNTNQSCVGHISKERYPDRVLLLSPEV